MATGTHADPPAGKESPLRYWRGEGPLWRLYWLYGVLASTAGGAIIMLLVSSRLVGPLGAAALIILGLVYTVWILVSVWRCAFNIETSPLGIEPETWGWVARVLTFGWAINVLGLSVLVLQIASGAVPP